ncbi:MAG: PAC2 family protein [Nanoarchaeota archaeon]|nr:PAC2 family protein [Nanoarchaeota archaeon]
MDKIKVELWENPTGVTIIEGFPGFGMVGTIATEALMDHLKPRLIGRVTSYRLPAMIAVHDGKIVEPLGIFYDEKNKIVIQHAVTNIAGLEWDLSEAVLEIAKALKAKEIISLEGIGSLAKKEVKVKPKAFYYSNHAEARKKFEEIGLSQLNEGIIVGVTGTLILKSKEKTKISCVFGETATGFPDSRAAATVIGVLDKYLGLNVPSEPLLKKAEEFESKLQGLFEKMKTTGVEKEKKDRVGYIT